MHAQYFGIQHSLAISDGCHPSETHEDPPHRFRLPFIYYQMPRLILIVSQKTSGINVRDSLLKLERIPHILFSEIFRDSSWARLERMVNKSSPDDSIIVNPLFSKITGIPRTQIA